MILVRNCKLLAALSTTGSENATTILCGHTLTEPVLVHSSSVVRLECSFHNRLCVILVFCMLSMAFRESKKPSFGLQNYIILLK